jgi:hypothetical protein
MITDKIIAKEVGTRILEANRLLNESVLLVDEQCSKAEAEKFKLAVAQVMAELLFSVVNPLYRQHPDIAPPGLDVPKT